MRGKDTQQSAMFSYVSPERRVPADHPLRPIRTMVDVALKGLSRSFGKMYPDWGRPSIAPEKLLRALLLQLLYSIRSERLLMEQLEYKSAVPLVCGVECGRAGVGPHGVQQESRPAVGGRDRREVLRPGAPSGARERSAVGRAFQCGRHADRSLGQPEEFSAQGRQAGSAAGRPRQPDGEFSRGKTQQRHASIDDGPGGAAGAKELGARVEASLLRKRADRESQRISGGHRTGDGERHG